MDCCTDRGGGDGDRSPAGPGHALPCDEWWRAVPTKALTSDKQLPVVSRVLLPLRVRWVHYLFSKGLVGGGRTLNETFTREGGSSRPPDVPGEHLERLAPLCRLPAPNCAFNVPLELPRPLCWLHPPCCEDRLLSWGWAVGSELHSPPIRMHWERGPRPKRRQAFGDRLCGVSGSAPAPVLPPHLGSHTFRQLNSPALELGSWFHRGLYSNSRL